MQLPDFREFGGRRQQIATVDTALQVLTAPQLTHMHLLNRFFFCEPTINGYVAARHAGAKGLVAETDSTGGDPKNGPPLPLRIADPTLPP